MNKKKIMQFFFTGGIIALLIGFFIAIEATNGFGGNNLDNVAIVDNQMVCNDQVEIYEHQNLTDFFDKNSYLCGYVDDANYQGRLRENCYTFFIPLESLVCSADRLYDGSERDRKLVSLVKWKILRQSIYLPKSDRRYDIVSYLQDIENSVSN